MARSLNGASRILTFIALFATGCFGPGPITDCQAGEGVTPVCEFQSPEDIVDLGDGWLIVSQAPSPSSPGMLVAFRPKDEAQSVLWPSADEGADRLAPGVGDAACPGAPDREAFVPHGIDLARDGETLLLVNHGGREAVEFFSVDSNAAGPTLRWSGCVPMPDEAMLNDVASLPDGGFVTTQMLAPDFSALNLLLGRNSGRVYAWSPHTGVEEIPDTAGVGPNGIAASRDGQTLYIAEWGAEALLRIGRDGTGRASVPLGFSPDNITWRPDGRLLVAGQIASPLAATRCFAVEEGTCGLAAAASSVDPDSLEVERIWTHDPATVAGGISVALEHEGRIWLGTFGGDRLAWIEVP